MTNRINGDFGQDSLEAFRAAYAAQMMNPEEIEVDPVMGMPTDVVTNTSPWIAHTGLWKANDGMSRDFKPNQPFNMEDYLDSVSESDADEEGTDLEDTEEGQGQEQEVFLTDDEFKSLSDEIWGDSGEDNDEEGELEPEPEDGTDGEMSEEEIDEMINEILGDEDENEEAEEGEEVEEDDYVAEEHGNEEEGND